MRCQTSLKKASSRAVCPEIASLQMLVGFTVALTLTWSAASPYRYGRIFSFVVLKVLANERRTPCTRSGHRCSSASSSACRSLVLTLLLGLHKHIGPRQPDDVKRSFLLVSGMIVCSRLHPDLCSCKDHCAETQLAREMCDSKTLKTTRSATMMVWSYSFKVKPPAACTIASALTRPNQVSRQGRERASTEVLVRP